MTTTSAPTEPVMLVTQTRVQPGKEAEFARWQQRMNAAVAAAPGVIDHSVVEPDPPAQLDWVIMQRFWSIEAAQAWLQSPERQRLLAEIAPGLAGQDDIHLFRSGSSGPPNHSVAAVISTRVAPDREEEFRAWQHRIAAAEARFPGFQGAGLEPPIPGVQEDWTSIVRFDSEEHLKAWLASSERQRLIDEAKSFSPEWRLRTVRGGFEGWFNFGDQAGGALPPAWKQNMVVLLVLYPIVFLFGVWVLTPLMLDKGIPFWLALFIAKIVSVVLMGYIVMSPVNNALKWWLVPRKDAPAWTNAAGVALVIALYGFFLGIFSQFP